MDEESLSEESVAPLTTEEVVAMLKDAGWTEVDVEEALHRLAELTDER